MVISGKELAVKVKREVADRVKVCTEKYGRAPHLEIILVGDAPDSAIYVRGKARDCENTGIFCRVNHLPADTPQEELLSLIRSFNADDSIDAILVQLPLPEHFDEPLVVDTIAPAKDCDGFHSVNIANLWQNRPGIAPCTPKGIMHMLEEAGVDPAGKHAVIVGRGNIVGKPMAKVLLDADATVTLTHSQTPDLADFTRRADIIIAAAGVPGLIRPDMVKPGAVIIDVAINRDPETGQLCGDVDFEGCLDICKAITPVPGGVGPMTKACLMENTLECFLNKMNKQ